MTISPTALHQPQTSPREILDALFRPMGVRGVYSRTGAYEDVVDALGAFMTRLRPAGAEVFRFPPVVSRSLIETSGYLKSFPHLLGCVCALGGGEARIEAAVDRFASGGTWTDAVDPSELVLAPAACYPLYPIAAARGPAPAEGLVFDVAGDCFRREPSDDIDRLQSFRMREFVAIGTADDVVSFRDRWIARAPEIAGALGLSHRIEAASDPFFGRAGAMVGRFQVAQALKFEMLVPVRSAESPTACMSFNYHRDHFGVSWGLQGHDLSPAHTACVAFGVDRLAIALFAAHGVDARDWPASVRGALGL
jgi:seryl-tRNA synthetase